MSVEDSKSPREPSSSSLISCQLLCSPYHLLSELDAVEPEEPHSAASSVFGDEACGSPQCAQLVLLDFTPGEEDDEYTQEKVCAFWDFVKSHPELFGQDMFEPMELEDSEPTDSEEGDPEVDQTLQGFKDMEMTGLVKKSAISALQLAEHTGKVDLAFNTERCSVCSLGSREYREGELTTAQVNTAIQKENAEGHERHSSFAVQSMCKDLAEWSDQHPKSTSPPRHLNIDDVNVESSFQC